LVAAKDAHTRPGDVTLDLFYHWKRKNLLIEEAPAELNTSQPCYSISAPCIGLTFFPQGKDGRHARIEKEREN